MRKHVTLITGAGGRDRPRSYRTAHRPKATPRSSPLTSNLSNARLAGQRLNTSTRAPILETHLLERILSEYEVETIYHLAAILSTRAEFTPVTGHQVNVEGTLKLLDFAQAQGESHGRAVAFLYPSSIAAYGHAESRDPRPPRARCGSTNGTSPRQCTAATSSTASTSGATTTHHYKQLAAETLSGKVDFRAIRFPGSDLGGDGSLGRHFRLRA